MDNSRYKVILVTGATGFIGQHMLHRLLTINNGPEQVIALDRRVHDSVKQSTALDTFICDLTDRRCVQEAIERIVPDGIIHLAGVTTGSNLSAYFEVNVQACENVLAAAAGLKQCPRILVIGSAAEYGISSGIHEIVDEKRTLLAKTTYGISKIVQENWALLYHHEKSVPVICVRPFNIIGPGQSDHLVPATFLCQIADVLRGTVKEICVGDISTQRDFIDVRDVVDALWALMNANTEADGQVFNISSGQPLKIADMLEACIKLSGRQIAVCRDPSRLKAHDVPVIVGDNTKLKKATGWQCRISWRESLETMWKYMIADDYSS